METDKKLKAVIIDDEADSIEALQWELEYYSEEVEVIATFSSPEAALATLPNLSVDMVFLDIEMPVLNGFDLLQRLEKIDFEVVFTTAYDEFAIKAIKVNALDYLLKPVDETELRKVLRKAREQQSGSDTQRQLEQLFTYLQKQRPGFPSIALPTMEGLEFVEADEILRCQSNSNYTYIYLTNNESFLVSRTLKEVEGLLAGHHFCRVHHSHVVNLKYVRRYLKGKGGELIMKDGTTVPVSRSRKEGLLKLF
ncbi:MAG TPA: response regulator transcription factor [Bacteroidetes bacterium]|nr:response regulator transcription factor [Bacteroidota bacterium]